MMDPRWLLIVIPVAVVAFLVGYFTGRRNGYWDGYGAAINQAVESNNALSSVYMNEIQRLKLDLEDTYRQIELICMKGDKDADQTARRSQNGG